MTTKIIYLKLGSKGEDVLNVQRYLNKLGYSLKEDGDFGVKTLRAVEQYQASEGLTVDGIVGASTYSALLLSAARVSSPRVADPSVDDRTRLAAFMSLGIEPRVHDVLLTAINALGLRETDASGKPAGTNGGAQLAHIVGGNGFPPSEYYLHWKVKDPSALSSMPPWCGIFVCWALKTGLKAQTWKDIPFGNYLGRVADIEDWGIAKGVAVKASDLHGRTEVSGAIFTMPRSTSGSDADRSTRAGHTGLVVGLDSYGKLVTIEGNVSNAVGTRRRSPAEISYLIEWWKA